MASSCLIIRADKALWPGSLHSSLILWELQVQAESRKQSFLSSTWLVISPYGTHLDSFEMSNMLGHFNINIITSQRLKILQKTEQMQHIK